MLLLLSRGHQALDLLSRLLFVHLGDLLMLRLGKVLVLLLRTLLLIVQAKLLLLVLPQQAAIGASSMTCPS